MGWLSDLLKEYPALSVAKERLALIEDRLKIVEAENEQLKAENVELKSKLGANDNRSKFIEFKGVLWTQVDGKVDTITYCPTCELAMSAFPPGSNEMVICSKCNFIAPFRPDQVDEMAKALESELLSA